MTYIFFDTNILLHFMPFDQIKWETLVDCIEYKICFAPIILKELDEHKYSSNKKVSRRAKAMLTKIDSLIEIEQDKVLFLTNRPRKITFRENQLSRKDQDDNLLASIIEFRKLNINETVLLITHDAGPRLKAKSLAIKYFKMPENCLLSEEMDESEKQLKALQKENLELKNRLPKLQLLFRDKVKKVKINVKPLSFSKESFITSKTEKLDKGSLYAKMPQDEIIDMGGLTPLRIPAIHMFNEEQISAYNQQIDYYFCNYEYYLEREYEHKEFLSRCLIIELILTNSGSAPAEDIDIYLYFPKSVKVFNKQILPLKPQMPVPPERLSIFNVNKLSYLMCTESITSL